jgi:hypothetical protein
MYSIVLIAAYYYNCCIVGLDVWRQKDESGLYDCRVLRKRTNDIKWMIGQGDIFNLMFRIRGGLARDMYGMQHEGLFSKAAAGTKMLVEDYHSTVAASLNYICDSTDDQVRPQTHTPQRE